MTDSAEVLWRPTAAQVAGSNVAGFLRWLSASRGLEFGGYLELWEWSTEDPAAFWGAVWEFTGLDRVSSYDEVLPHRGMPGAKWFSGARLNFAERCLACARDDRPAVISVDERGEPVETSWAGLRAEVAAVAGLLRAEGVRPGDHVAAYLPNVREALVGVLATAAVGAVWTACSPDFGISSVLARFRQVEPVVLVASPGYVFGGKEFDRREHAAELLDGLPSVRLLLTTDGAWPERPGVVTRSWPEPSEGELVFADTAFDDPLWVLWSSGTTGVPKGIVQGHGGIVVELLKSVGLCSDITADDRFGFITSTSWMVWNYLVGGLLVGATVVLYDGSPTHPDVDQAWRIAELTGTTVLGVGAGYLVAGEKSGSEPRSRFDLSRLRSLLQTGSTMPPSAWRWVYSHVSETVWLQSICGGTDVCSALAGAAADLPVYTGRLTAPALGVALAAWDPDGRPLVGEQGELVVTQPLPSMPLRFVDDPDGERYRASYFDMFPGVWRHGDWVTVHEDASLVVAGRSDSTLNRMGVRMGSADIYAVVERFPEIADSLVIGAELPDGGYAMPLFVVLADGHPLDDELRTRLKAAIRAELSPRHVPDDIVEVAAVPRTLTGKKLEVPVKRILQGAAPEKVTSPGAVTNAETLAWFADYGTRLGTA